MGSILAAAWRVVLKRARADWHILSAALLTILLATTLLSAGPIYAGAVAVSGLRRALHDAPSTRSNLQTTAYTTNRDFASLDEIASRAAAETVGPIGGTILRSGRSESFALPEQPAEAVRNLTVFAFYQQIEQHATLLSGNWGGPQLRDGAVEAAVSQATAEHLNLTVGSSLEVVSRLEAPVRLRVRISGIYQLNDRNDPFWWNDPLDLDGIVPGSTFTTYGPLVIAPNLLLGSMKPTGSEVRWRVYPHFDRIKVGDVSTLIRTVDDLRGRLNAGRGANDQFQVQTDLNGLLRTAQRSLLVTRSGVLIVTVQLAILAGYALLLTANLLVDGRRIETGLLHSRGGSTGQIATMALMEALILAVPAALAGPWLAALSLRALNHVGPLASISLALDPQVTRGAYALSSLSALGCVVALTLPSLQSARSFVTARAARGRQLAQGLAQRAGIDLLLLVGAALAYWQLRRYGAPITETVQGRLGLDPFLVAAPAIGLLAGAVVALRIVPLLARVIDRTARRQRALVPSLGAWQVARRPLRYARAALLLMLAVAIGLFALSYGSTWALSQRDQADYQVGADIRVRPDIRTGTSIPGIHLADAYTTIDGVIASIPVSRDLLQVSRSAGTGRLLALDAAQAAQVVNFRPDLADEPFPALMERLAQARPSPGVIPVPGRPQRLAFDLRLTLDPLPSGTDVPRNSTSITPTVAVVVRDARGMLYRMRLGGIAADGVEQRLIAPLAYRTSDGRVVQPEYPISIAAFEFGVTPLQRVVRQGQLDLLAVRSSAGLQGDDWALVSLPTDALSWSIEEYSLQDHPSLTPANVQPPNGLAVRFTTGSFRGTFVFPVTFHLRAGSPVPDILPALVSEGFLAATSTRAGDIVPLDVGGRRRDVRIVGSLRGFPTIEPEAENIIVVDLPTLATLRFQASGNASDAAEWWIAAREDRRAAVAEALSAAPFFSVEIQSRERRSASLRSDPVALGIIGALSLGFVAATIFASIGFAVSAAVSARERLTEFALLRALGLSTGQLSGWLTLENGILAAISLLGGTALGLLLAWLILPLVSLTQAATRIMPGIIVVVPWRSVLLLQAITILALAVVIGVLAALLRRIGLGSTLRLGEE